MFALLTLNPNWEYPTPTGPLKSWSASLLRSEAECPEGVAWYSPGSLLTTGQVPNPGKCSDHLPDHSPVPLPPPSDCMLSFNGLVLKCPCTLVLHCIYFIYLCIYFAAWGMEPRAPCTLSKSSATKLHPQPFLKLLKL